MAIYRRFKVQQKYVNGQPTEEYRLGVEVDGTNYHSLEACESGSECTELEYRWVDMELASDYYCEGTNKYKKQKKQQKCVNEETWTDVYPYEYRAGDLIEHDSVDCGYEPLVEYHIYGATDGHGSINISPSKEYYSSTDIVTITTLPSANYMFSCYNYGSTSEYGQISTNSTLMLTMTHDWYVSAVFSYSLSLYYLYTLINGEGSIMVTPSKHEYSQQENVNILAFPSANYMFEYYEYGSTPAYGSTRLRADLDLIMSNNWYVKANFVYGTASSGSLYYSYYTGEEAWYEWSKSTLSKKDNNGINASIIIDYGGVVQSISNKSFYSHSYLTKIILPNVRYIGSSAFLLSNKNKLETVIIPNVEYIGWDAFAFNSKLSQIDIPLCSYLDISAFCSCTSLEQFDGKILPVVASNTFNMCSNLTNLNIPLCTYIYDSAFANCVNLPSIDLPVCSVIGPYAFYGCYSLESASLPQCQLIDGYAFYGCSNLRKIDLPMVSYISHSAFESCTSLIYVNAQNCTSIGYYAFAYCSSLINVNFPICSEVGGHAFYHCSSLTSIDLSMCTIINGGAFAFCSALSSVNLPNCKSVHMIAFYNCYSLINVNLQNCTLVGESTFTNCQNLKSIDLPNCLLVDNYAFSDCIELSYINLQNCSQIYGEAFYNCKKLTSVNLQHCESIYNSVFIYCENLSSIDLPVCSVIGSDAFLMCHNLQDVYLGSSKVVQIGSSSNYAFEYCNNDLKIHIPNNLCEYYNKRYKGASVHLTYENKYLSELFVCDLPSVIINSIYYSFSNGSYSWYSFDSNVWWRESHYRGAAEIIDYSNVIYETATDKIGSSTTNMTNLKYISLNGAEIIASHTFKAATNLERVSFPNVRVVWHMAFAYCYSLRSIVLPKLERIGQNVFSSCKLLSYVSLGNLSFLNDQLFINCPNLTNITLTGSSVCSFDTTAIPNPNENLSINVPASLLDDYKIAWSSLSERIFPL